MGKYFHFKIVKYLQLKKIKLIKQYLKMDADKKTIGSPAQKRGSLLMSLGPFGAIIEREDEIKEIFKKSGLDKAPKVP